MSYVDGYVLAVPTANREAYRKMAEEFADLFKKLGALAVMECWGDDLPEGEVNSFHTSVMRKDEEAVVFSWAIWPSKEVRVAAWEKMMSDPDMKHPEAMPFDGTRMIYGGFVPFVER
jgi:uncharacterized protein YbaA (DUF1428 family)